MDDLLEETRLIGVIILCAGAVIVLLLDIFFRIRYPRIHPWEPSPWEREALEKLDAEQRKRRADSASDNSGAGQ